MRRREFIDMILNSISDTFDIYHNYWFEGRKFVIYAYSYNKKDRFSTTDDAKLWDSKCYEHLFFINCDTLGSRANGPTCAWKTIRPSLAISW